MIRELRYFVLKVKDVHQLPTHLWDQLVEILDYCETHYPKREYVVVESDWPEYEKVWKMIEERVDSETPSPT